MKVYASAETTLTDTNDGISVTGIDRYYMASSSSSGITVDSQGWKPDPQETNPISRYHWSYEVVNYSSGPPVPTKPAVIGVYGDSAKMLYLSATAESMTFNADGVPSPSSQVITLTANLQNVSGNVSFAATAYNGSTVVSDVVLSGVGNTRTFNQAQFPASANRVQVRATLGDLVDTVTIVKLSNGSKGENAIVGLLTNESITLPADKDGLVSASNFTGAKGVFDVYDGITKKTGTGVKYSVVNQLNITVNIDATGAYAVTAMPTGTAILNGYATLRAIYNGVTIEKQLNVAKSLTGATGATGSSGKDGVAGKDGKGISSTTITYGLSTTDTVEPTKYTSEVPPLTKGQYLWTKTVWKYTDNTTETGYTKTYIAKDGNNGEDGLPGKTGVGISSTKIEYAGSTSGTVKPTSGWKDQVPTVAPGNYLWTKTTWTYTDNTTESGYTVARMGVNGATGGKGDTGSPGASATSYWITASNNIIGKSQTGVINPTTITFNGFSKTGTATPVAYSGRFIIQTSTNGTTYTTRYTTPSNTNQDSCTYGIPADSLFVKCLFYMANGTTVLLDEQTIPIVESAEGIQVGGRNLYIVANSEEGYLNGNDGGMTTAAPNGERTSEYINISNAKNITISYVMYPTPDYKWYGYSFYDADKVNIGGRPAWHLEGTENSTTTEVMTLNVPDNAVYIRVSARWLENEQCKLQVEKGTKATDWTLAPEDARTYKAWANSSEGSVDFTRVYPNDNLISKADITTGGFLTSTGAFSANEAWFHTDYIPVAGMTKLVTSGYTNLGSSPSTVYYNSEKAFVKGINNNGQSLAKDITIDSGIDYIRFSGVIEDLPTLKLEQGTTPTIYTTNTADSLSGSIPKYVGFSPIDSDVPHEYEWIMNPEYSQALADEALAGKVNSDAEYENLKNMAQEVKESYENFVSEGGEYQTEHSKLLDRTTAIETDLGEYRQQINFVDTYMSAGKEGLIIGVKDSEGNPDANAMQMLLSNKSLSFMDNGDVVAYFSGQSFHINKGAIIESIQVGQHIMTDLGNGHTVFKYIG